MRNFNSNNFFRISKLLLGKIIVLSHVNFKFLTQKRYGKVTVIDGVFIFKLTSIKIINWIPLVDFRVVNNADPDTLIAEPLIF